MKQGIWVLTLSLVLTIAPASGWAARTRVHEAAESPQYGRKFGGMIGRGALNVLTSFVDVIVNVVNETKAGPPFVGTLTGVGKGVGCGVLRLGSGAVDLVTFWVPGFNGFPVSDSYENCMAGTSMSRAEAPMPPASGPAIQPATVWQPPKDEPGAAQVSATPVEPAPQQKRVWKK
jgi:putative exosortase-associated protein (TIGR04073 family)